MTERELAEHEARGSRNAEIRRTEERRNATINSVQNRAHEADEDDIGFTGATNAAEPSTNAPSEGKTSPFQSESPARAATKQDNTPSIQSLVDSLAPEQRDAVTKRAQQIARAGPTSPAWPAALSIAMRELGFAQ